MGIISDNNLVFYGYFSTLDLCQLLPAQLIVSVQRSVTLASGHHGHPVQPVSGSNLEQGHFLASMPTAVKPKNALVIHNLIVE